MQSLRTGDPRAIGPFRIVGRLGSGAMGQVFLGRSAGGRAVVVKTTRPELSDDPEFRKRFAREVASAREVSGPYSAVVVDADPDAERPWFATEYVPGLSLTDAVSAHGPLPERSLWPLVSGLAEALDAIHSVGLVHRDLKPSNVLLTSGGPRLIDFGIAYSTTASALTGTGVTVGTPGFMSPEQITGRSTVAPSTDVFALGAVLAFASTGRGPFGISEAQVMMFRTVHEDPVLDGMPGALRALALRCLAKDPAARPTPAELRLEAQAQGQEGAAGSPGPDWLPAPVSHDLLGRVTAVLGAEPPQELPGSEPSGPEREDGPGGVGNGPGGTTVGLLPKAPVRDAGTSTGTDPEAGSGPDPVPHDDEQPQLATGASPAPQPQQHPHPHPHPPTELGQAPAGPGPHPPADGSVPRKPERSGPPAGRAGSVTRRRVLTGAALVGVAGLGTMAWVLRDGSRGDTPRTGGSTGPGSGASTTSPRSGEPSATPAADVSSGKQLWRTDIGHSGDFGSRPPALAGSTAYCASADGNLYAVNARTGDRIWKSSIGTSWSTPATDGSRVYVGTIRGKLLAVDRTRGAKRWEFTTGDRGGSMPGIGSSATVSGSTVYFASDNTNLYAVDAQSGKERWKFTAGYALDSTPKVSGDTVYVGSMDNSLYAVDAGSGSLRWSYPTGSDLVSSPAVADGIVYIGSRDGNLHAVDAKTGKRRWRWAAQVTDYSPVVSGGVVYVAYDLELFALDAATGRKRWAFPMHNSETNSGTSAAPAVWAGTVFASGSNTLYAVNAGTGRKRWSLELEGNPSDPVAAAGAVFITCDDGFLYAIRA